MACCGERSRRRWPRRPRGLRPAGREPDLLARAAGGMRIARGHRIVSGVPICGSRLGPRARHARRNSRGGVRDRGCHCEKRGAEEHRSSATVWNPVLRVQGVGGPEEEGTHRACRSLHRDARPLRPTLLLALHPAGQNCHEGRGGDPAWAAGARARVAAAAGARSVEISMSVSPEEGRCRSARGCAARPGVRRSEGPCGRRRPAAKRPAQAKGRGGRSSPGGAWAR
jgi:hypothetical protein